MLIDEINDGENKYIEFKQVLPSSAIRYVKTLVAFANTSGGKLIIGIADDTREVVGVPRNALFKIMDSIADAVTNLVTPQLIPDISFQTIEDKTVVVVEVYPGLNRPYFIKTAGKEAGTFIRVAGTTRNADEFSLKELELQGCKRYYDNLPDLRLKFDETLIQKMCSNINRYLKQNNNMIEHIVTKDTLLNWGLLYDENGRLMPTNAFSLMWNNEYKPSIIQCAVFKGVTRANFLDRKEFTGPIYEQVDEAYKYVLQHIDMGMKLNGIFRQDVYELPPSAIREAIVNAVCHRNYMIPSSIQVAIYDDRVEITSPGSLYGTLRYEQLKTGRSSIRNWAVASAFSGMGIIEKWGTGIQRIYEDCEKYDGIRLEMIDYGDAIRVNFFRNRNNATNQSSKISAGMNAGMNAGINTGISAGINATEEEILNLLLENPTYTATIISEKMGRDVRTIEKAMKKLKEKGLIYREGSRRNGRWIVKAGEIHV